MLFSVFCVEQVLMDYVEEERNIKARSQALAAFKEQIL
jgi:hypothetical protein